MIDRKNWRNELKARFSEEPVWPEPEHEEGWRDLICDLIDVLDETGVNFKIVQLK